MKIKPESLDKFFVFNLIGSGWLVLSTVILVKYFEAGMSVLWPFVLLVIFGGYALLLLIALAKFGPLAGFGMVFLPGGILLLLFLVKAIPVPSVLYPYIFTEQEYTFLGGKFEQHDHGIKLIALPIPYHCNYGPCREILFETPYNVAVPGSNGKEWAIYKIGTGDVCVAPENLAMTLILVQENILGRCIVSEVYDQLPDAIMVEPYRSEPSRESSILKIGGWNVRELKDGKGRRLGAWVWGEALTPIGGGRMYRIDKEIGTAASEIDILNAVLGLELDGIVDSGEKADVAAIAEFLQPYLLHPKPAIRYKAQKKIAEINASLPTDQKKKKLSEIEERARSLLKSGKEENINDAIQAVGSLEPEYFSHIEEEIVELALTAPEEKRDDAQILLLLRKFGGPKRTFSDKARRAALTHIKHGADMSQMRLRLAFLLATSGGPDNRDETFAIIMSLPSSRHEQVVANLANEAKNSTVDQAVVLWSSIELDQLLARATKLSMPAFVPYLESLRKAIQLRNREYELESVLVERHNATTDPDQRLALEAFASSFKIHLLDRPIR